MKATGIVRRIDELGRIVIPKEIRRTLGIREGAGFFIFLALHENLLNILTILNIFNSLVCQKCVKLLVVHLIYL